jgi:hypothetical protein
MGQFACGKLVSCVLLLSFPASVFAADSNAAMLYTDGSAWVNGAPVPRPTTAIFLGDLLQTRSDSVANINSPGSTITVFAGSLVKFEGSSVNIEHGGVTVSTSKAVATSAGGVKVWPASEAWTEFNVMDVDGTIRIAARKGDLTVSDGTSTITLPQGQETTRDENSDQSSDKNSKEKKKSKKRGEGAAPGASGGILNSPLAIGIGAGAVGLVTGWALWHNDQPASPSKP